MHCLMNMTSKGTRKILVVSLRLFVQKCCCSQWQQKDWDKLELHSLRLQLSFVLGHQNHCQEMGKFGPDLGVIRIAYFYDQRNNSPSGRPLGEKPHQCHSVQNKDIRVFHTELCKANIPILCSLWLKYIFCLFVVVFSFVAKVMSRCQRPLTLHSKRWDALVYFFLLFKGLLVSFLHSRCEDFSF